MRYLLVMFLFLTTLFASCVDPEDLTLRGTVDIIVVDGTINNLAEAQIIQLNRSKADPLTGRFGSTPIKKASVEVVEDSSRIITCHETIDGSYQLPSDFKGQIDHAYQLRFTLSDGTKYVSNQQIMPTVPPIDRVSAVFSASSLPSGSYANNFRAGYNLLVNTQDPPSQRNYYRWDWALYEKQTWCRSCYQGIYVDTTQQGSLQNGMVVTELVPVEDCYLTDSNRDFYNRVVATNHKNTTICKSVFYLLALI